MQYYIDLVARIARRYTLPTQCPITRDDLIQEALLALLEAPTSSIKGEFYSPHKVYAIARRAMQRAIARYISPVTRSLDAPISPSTSGEGRGEATPTLADTIAAPDERSISERQTRDDILDSALAYIDTLEAQLAAGTITPANFRKKKQRFLQKLRKKVSQNNQ